MKSLKISLKFTIALFMLMSCQTPWAMPSPQSWTLENGLKVVFLPTHEIPIVDIRITFNAGSAQDKAHPGLARMTANLILKETKNFSEMALAEQIDALGVVIGSGAARDMAWLQMRSLSQSSTLNPAVALFKEILAHPTFSDSVIAREKQEMEMGIDAIQQSPSALANQLFYEVLFENHPYASPTGGTRESLKRIHFNQLRDFHATHYVARNGALTIVGNLTQPEAEKLAAHIATALPEGAPADPLPDMPKSRGTRVVYQPYPSSQCHIRIGTIAIQANDPHQDALLAANHLLGGDTLNSRLGGVIREERGLSYSISSWFVPMQSPGPFAISTEVQPQRLIEAITAIQHTLDEWRNTPVSPDELEQIQKTLAGRYPLQLTSNQSLLGQLANFAFYDMDPEKLNTYIERIQRLTPEALYQAVHSFWETSQWVIVIVGGTAT